MELPESIGALRRMRDGRQKKLREIGPMLKGSLVKMPKHTSLYLTSSKKGKTRTMYIPLDRLEEAKEWNANYKEAKELLEELCEIQRALLQAEIKKGRAEKS